MQHAAISLALIAGLAVQGCGGSRGSTAAPSTAADREDAEPQEEESVAEPPESPLPDEVTAEPSSPPRTESESLQEDEEGAGECRESEAKLKLVIDRKLVNIEEGRLEAEMDGPICQIGMKITLKDGETTVEKAFRFTGTARQMRWDPIPRDEIEKIEIRVTGDDGGYQSVFLIPWSVRIEHKEVEFDTDRAIIRPSEVPSLEDSYAKIQAVLAKVEGKQLGKVTLFIAGHTDTQGSDGHNLTLSRDRARAIAAWFLKRGLCTPIAYEGFGETALKKLTADEVDEQENRRVDYILAVEPPLVTKGRAPAWKYLTQGC
ncbi:MAG TPA: OmpA family protein [Polyangiaceae bacterium]|nr:OmpA family protein [Polyangiaceae bacterium]